MLDLSKIEAGRMELFRETFDVCAATRDVMDTGLPLAQKNGNELILNCAEDIGTMNADLTKLRQALLNLLSNAAKFTQNGTIRLDVERGPKNEAHRRESVVRDSHNEARGRESVVRDSHNEAHRRESVVRGSHNEAHRRESVVRGSQDHGAEWISFRVADTGIGIEPDKVERLFKPFEQADASTSRQYGGTGLGLTLSRRFCRLMGGDLSATSAPGEGSVFTIELPVNAAAAETDSKPPKDSDANSGADILVVDDNPNARDLVDRTLRKEGYRTALAGSGIEALKLARELRPSAITLDVMMPAWMDGPFSAS